MDLKARLDALLGNAAKAAAVPGVIAMAADREHTLYEGAFGERRLGSGTPMTTDTVVWIASMSKLFSGLPGTSAGPVSPPLRSSSRESMSSPPFTFSPVALWHL